MSRARIVELILTEELVGEGTEDNPHRPNLQLWTKSGMRVAQEDIIGQVDGKLTYLYLGAIEENDGQPVFHGVDGEWVEAAGGGGTAAVSGWRVNGWPCYTGRGAAARRDDVQSEPYAGGRRETV